MRNENIEDIYNLSPIQDGILFHSLHMPDSGMYFEQFSWSAEGDLDLAAFERAWQSVVDRHPVLRTSFFWEDLDEALQMVSRRVRLPMEQLDWRILSPNEQRARLEAFLRADRARGFELTEPPLMRLTLIRLDERAYRVVWRYHHLLLDGWSVALLMEEVFSYYEAHCQGQSLRLERRRPYRDYISWLQRQDMDEAKVFWQRTLQGFSAPTRLPLDQQPAGLPDQHEDYGMQQLQLAPATTEALQALARQHHVTLNTLVQGAWALLLSCYSGEGDVVFGTTVSGRPANLAGVEKMIGVFINTLPVRVRVPPRARLLDWLKELQDQQVALRQYEHSPLVEVQGWSEVPRGKPLFESIVVFENYPVDRFGRMQNAQVFQKTNYPLTIVAEPGAAFSLRIGYDARRFGTAMIARMLLHLQTLLERMVARPELRLADLSPLTADEWQELVVTRNTTRTDYPREICFHQLFEAQVTRTPDAVAVVFDGRPTTNDDRPPTNDHRSLLHPFTPSPLHPFTSQHLTYDELNHRANQLAHHLRELGVRPGVRVAICAERSFDMLIGLLGIFKAGGAFVPIEPAFPRERMAFMLADAQVDVLLTQQKLRERLPDNDQRPTTNDQRPTTNDPVTPSPPHPVTPSPRHPLTPSPCHPLTPSPHHLVTPSPRPRVVCLDTDWAMIAQESSEHLPKDVTPDNLAYIIYTSGSTGKPKGVLIPHYGLVNYLVWCAEAYGAAHGRGAPVHASIAADAIFPSLFAPLLVGTSVVLFPGEDALEALGTAMHTEGRFSMIKITPSQLEVLNHQLPQTNANGWVRTLVVGAEALRGEVLTFWQANAPTTILLNEYGPTETVVGCSIYQVSAGQPIAGAVPIGLPIANTQFYVLDAQMRPVPIGVPGELYIGGDGVAWGYHNRPDLTAERFVPNPFLKIEDRRLKIEDSGLAAHESLSSIFYPLSSESDRLYKTGDLVRYLPDRAGNIEFLGRIDDQVKIRGYRIEPGEIAAALLQHPVVRDAVVVAREDMPGDTRLVAYVVLKIEDRGLKIEDSGSDAPDPLSSILYPLSSELRSFLKERLPEYMVPSAFVLLDALPLAPHGKLDRRALPAPDMTSLELRSAYVAPRNPLEEQLAAIWADVLGVEQVGVHDNFFALGGHSLLATQIVSRVRRTLQVELSLRSLFETPTVATLAERVETMRRSAQALHMPPIRPVARDDALPLSFAQQRLWFLHQLQPDSPAYNIPVALRLVGPLDVPALEHSLNTIIARHESLRTTFALLDGRPVQRITPQLTLTLTVEDLPAAQHDGVRRRFTAENQQPFDLARGPLVRTTLLRLAAQEHLLLLTMHHIVSDGWSTGVLIQEASLLYSAAVQGRPAALPDLPIQYADFAVWQRAWLQGDKETRRQGDKEQEASDLPSQPAPCATLVPHPSPPPALRLSPLEAQLAYWREQLGGRLPVLDLPTDRPRPAVQTFQGRVAPFTFPLDLARALTALSQQEGVTLFMTLLAAFQTLLHRYSTQDDLIVGSPIAGRTHAETEGLIGFFVNTLALRVRLAGDPRFRELLGRVREVCLGAYAHQDLPFEKLVEELRPERDLSRTPLFQVMLVLQNAPASALELAGLTLYQLQIDGGTARFDLNMSLEESDRGLRGLLEYNTDLFDDATIARLLRHFETILQGVVAQPEQRLSALPLMSDAERRQVLAQWSATGTDELPEQCLHQLIEAQAARTPNAIALVFDRGQGSGTRGQEDKETRRQGDKEIGYYDETQPPSPNTQHPTPNTQLPYRELNRRANQLAHHLRALKVGPEVPVAVCMERSPELVIALLGILKAGGAYVPLDPTYPQERLAFMLADTQAPVLLTQAHLLGRLSQLTTDHRPPTTDHRPPTNDHRPPTTDHRPPTTDCNPPIPNPPSPIPNPPSPIPNPQSPSPIPHPPSPIPHPEVVCLDSDWPLIARLRTDAPPSRVAPDNLAYVIYTSGSTGVPKGVMTSHRAIVNRLRWMQATYHLAAHDHVLQKTPISFDVSVWELFWPLLTGACMVLARPGSHQDSAYLRQLIVDQAITTLHFVPSMLGVFLEERDLAQCTSLARVICSGEPLSYELQERYFARLDEVELHNLYGPTEAAIDVTAWACERASAHRVVPIGRPIANMQVYVLDSHLQPVPVGVPGELHLGGVGLARGYLYRPDLTAERFIPNPFGGVLGDGCRVTGVEPSNTQHPSPNTRLYRTGDLVRYLADGVIEYLGRIDGQVKLRGYRIELGEIEAALERHSAVRAAVVVAREDVPGDRRLVAYVVPKIEDRGLKIEDSNSEAPEPLSSILYPLSSELRGFLKEQLPDYMIPSAFVQLEALPLTPNGKLDRRALPAPDSARPDLGKGFVAPRTATEEQLAGVMAEILVLERVGVYDSFFELGGHSLLAIQLLARLRDVFDLELPLRTLYEAPNVADLAMVIVQRQADHMDTETLDQMLAELGELSDAEVQMLLADEEVNQDASA